MRMWLQGSGTMAIQPCFLHCHHNICELWDQWDQRIPKKPKETFRSSLDEGQDIPKKQITWKCMTLQKLKPVAITHPAFWKSRCKPNALGPILPVLLKGKPGRKISDPYPKTVRTLSNSSGSLGRCCLKIYESHVIISNNY